MLTRRFTFEEAIRSADFSLVSKQRLEIISLSVPALTCSPTPAIQKVIRRRSRPFGTLRCCEQMFDIFAFTIFVRLTLPGLALEA